MKNDCKFCVKEATFNTEGKDENVFDTFDGKAHSFKGIWIEDKMGICTKFESADEQFKSKCGFCYCDDKRATKCSYYEEEEEEKVVNLVETDDKKLKAEGV